MQRTFFFIAVVSLGITFFNFFFFLNRLRRVWFGASEHLMEQNELSSVCCFSPPGFDTRGIEKS